VLAMIGEERALIQTLYILDTCPAHVTQYAPTGSPSGNSRRWPERPPLPPVCWGFTTIRDRVRLERLVRRLRRAGYLSENAPSFAKMVESAEKRLFRAIVTNPGHVLHHSLRREKSTGYNLRPRANNFELPWKDTRNFLAHLLHSTTYCNNHS